MTDLLPIVELLASCSTHLERADWLKRCPDGVIFRDLLAIGRVLSVADFPTGAAYLHTRHAAINSVRLPDGSLPQTRVMAVNAALIDMTIAARADASKRGF